MTKKQIEKMYQNLLVCCELDWRLYKRGKVYKSEVEVFAAIQDSKAKYLSALGALWFFGMIDQKKYDYGTLLLDSFPIYD